MSDEPHVEEHEEHHDDEVDAGYAPPPEKSLDELMALDTEDESLRKYKATLLGQATAGEVVIVDESNPSRVIVRRLALVVEGRDDVVLDLSGDLETLKSQTITIKEGIQYRLRIEFHVQRDIVTGLRYTQKTYRKGIQVDKMNQMLGSYGPRKEVHTHLTPMEDAPSGMLARGTYHVKSVFCDDDKNEYLKWEWSFEIKKDW
ncbi:Rho GDP-dissociation inhibitor 2 [Amphibalanus amphitrite]|uniref:Rho GDP-dissociation inhibitor 3 n=2 Tax=Amphibalanus amphitrite TaxID=1232801 RepID=A0A6A4WTG2_AMPAM|nr:rho GDP-dissociation inhibitor 2-like isoform X2 [Amphibalanus amphitrite]XP_043206744.1 rho GDP-dissociation inhibitor 2-like isoform X2 [Amphibalanus amphitrite]XP_043206747.1 rho GDP-dissociation inhibitor 2-like isoform X2 [Amphibalanus amphitrite]KAF0308549.1 Rho GDP-dissociation inhibitor 2 [Amphibalanus amphitrite]